ncbi:Integrase, catalytic region [Thermosinus carboxydivorans Nor1]|uniref:Integrase, catalytic region n=1 Tax=Thermosinus carboxydivorans Nor1 TaxID=401526 RepID=A1HM44_9FIRM|nr:IS481 family transposase [Thermosinus carboxydivorans]EAX48895.1 Integrase, catalytic region [Thermosinus carboxydivorans Nor1]
MDCFDDVREKALARFSLIAPLLAEGLDAAERRRRRREILASTTISDRTLRRYLAAYRKQGFAGLLPQTRSDKGKRRKIPDDVFKHAAKLKEELPERSTLRVLDILVGEKTIKPGEIARSTLARHLARLGLTRRAKSSGTGSRRFQKEHRNKLWQADIKYGPYIVHPQNPQKKLRTYLVAFIDDASRLICHGQFYLEQKLAVLEDCFRKAILKRGIPEGVYIDNGKIFISRWFRLASAKLGIRHITAAPYSPEAKGKIERFNRTVEEFLAEVSLSQPKTLEELNKAFAAWVEEGYNHRPHSALDGQTPAERFQSDVNPIRFATLEECREAFLWEETRRVDKTGCLKLCGKIYEAGIDLIGKTVDVRYDPFDLAEIEIWHNGRKHCLARELIISETSSAKPKEDAGQPDRTASAKPSRLLAVLEQKAIARRKMRLGAIAYRQLGGGDDSV